MIILGVTLILAIANIIDLTIRVNYKKDTKDTPDDKNKDD